MRIHDKPKKVKQICPVSDCDFEYTDARNLRMHRMIEHEHIEGYLCPKCDKISYRADDAKKHLKVVHQLTTVPQKARWTLAGPRTGLEEGHPCPYFYKLDTAVELISYKKTLKKYQELGMSSGSAVELQPHTGFRVPGQP